MAEYKTFYLFLSLHPLTFVQSLAHIDGPIRFQEVRQRHPKHAIVRVVVIVELGLQVAVILLMPRQDFSL